MQPHSMCAIAAANYIWNQPSHPQLHSCLARVTYQSFDYDGKTRSLYYKMFDFYVEPNLTYLRLSVERSHGGLYCRMHLERSSAAEGNKVTQDHDNHHVHGLQEIYHLYKRSIKNGHHGGKSGRYRNFSGDLYDYDRKRMDLDCEVKIAPDVYKFYKYKLELEDIKLG